MIPQFCAGNISQSVVCGPLGRSLRDLLLGPGRQNCFNNNRDIICLFHCVGICINGTKAIAGQTADLPSTNHDGDTQLLGDTKLLVAAFFIAVHSQLKRKRMPVSLKSVLKL